MKIVFFIIVFLGLCTGIYFGFFHNNSKRELERVEQLLRLNNVERLPEYVQCKVRINDKKWSSDVFVMLEIDNKEAIEEFLKKNSFEAGFSTFPNKEGWENLPIWWDFEKVPAKGVYWKENIFISQRGNLLYIYGIGGEGFKR